ncbi:STAS domain-containing protein [Chitinibacter bivalviorum]|uniref:STAS domain-containing protein n=1 Tax=Chitinibacter bivalviorum TaxID=2739434 RepID=A0A7H9BG56_9NEIS|nr:SulP family inorganic anion transporter [Chitinibacter bivalviorum]QLG86911.1 STAS domain-containing protein [Chitinibacter bivalviorum]
MIAVLEAQRAGLFKRQHILPNLIAGVVVGVVALPLAMAFAIASGAKPEQGIYTALIAGLVVGLCGGSRVQIAGPTGAFIVILAAITAQHGIVGLEIATMMAGVILLLMGVAKLGGVIKFIPAPVIVGFTAGIGVIIWLGQWPAFFGLPTPTATHFHEKLWVLLQSLTHLHWATTALAALGLAVLLITPKVKYLNRLPAPLIAMLLVTLIQYFAQFAGVKTIGSAFGGIPQGLPAFAWPEITLARLIELIGPAFTIAMLGAIESLLSAVVADGMAGTRHDSNQELIGQGLANMVIPLFGGFAATGAIARTATNIRNGGNSPLASVIHSVTLLLILLFLAPLAAHIPLAVLAAILFIVAWNMSEVKHFFYMLTHAPRADVAILLITFFLTVFADLVVAVNIGVILATMHFLRRMSMSVEVAPQDEKTLAMDLLSQGLMKLPTGVLVYSIEGPFFFGAVENFQRVLHDTHTDPKVLIIRLLRVPFMDMTGLQTLDEVVASLQERGVVVILCEANEMVSTKLARSGVVETLKAENLLPTFAAAICRADAVCQ